MKGNPKGRKVKNKMNVFPVAPIMHSVVTYSN